jgi:hypothetical protein
MSEIKEESHDFVFMILNCYKYRSKAVAQINGWLSKIQTIYPIPYYHILGNPTLSTPYVFNDEEHILYVKTKDDYPSLPHKVIAAQRAIYERYNFKYLFKTDDDQVLRFPIFIKQITDALLISSTQENKFHYGGKIVSLKYNSRSSYHLFHPELSPNIVLKKGIYATGRFYFLSREAVEDLLQKEQEISKEEIEDYSIGQYLSPCYKENSLQFETGIYFIDSNL